MKIFRKENEGIVISDEAFALKAFRQIWNRDRSMSKERAIMELGYCYFMEDPRSDYQYIVDREERSEAIKKGEGLKESWKPDNLVKDAMELYASFKTTASLLLDDTRLAVDKLRSLLKNIDLTKTDDKGKPIYTLNTVAATIRLIPSMVKDLDEAERALAKEMANSDKVRGAQEKSIYEDL